MGEPILCAAVDCLREEYSNLNWTYHDSPTGATEEKMYYWPGCRRKKSWSLSIRVWAIRSCSTGMTSSISITPIRGNMIPSALSTTTVSRSAAGSYMQDSRLPDTRSAFTMTRKP